MLKIDYFNPVVKDWTPECQEREIKERETCDYCLYVITPKMTGVYSIAEVTDDSNKRPEKTLYCCLEMDGDAKFTPAQYKSLIQTAKLVKGNGAIIFLTLNDIANYLNTI